MSIVNIVISSTEPSKRDLWLKDGVLRWYSQKGWLPVKTLDSITSRRLNELIEEVRELERLRLEDSEKIDSLDKEVGDLYSVKQDKIGIGEFSDLEENFIEAGKQYYNSISNLTISEYINFSINNPETIIVSIEPITFEGDNIKIQQNIADLNTTDGVYTYIVRYIRKDSGYMLLINGSCYE